MSLTVGSKNDTFGTMINPFLMSRWWWVLKLKHLENQEARIFSNEYFKVKAFYGIISMA